MLYILDTESTEVLFPPLSLRSDLRFRVEVNVGRSAPLPPEDYEAGDVIYVRRKDGRVDVITLSAADQPCEQATYDDIRLQPLSVLRLPVRTITSLQSNNIITVGDLIKHTKEQILFSTTSEKATEEIESMLGTHNLHLRQK